MSDDEVVPDWVRRKFAPPTAEDVELVKRALAEGRVPVRKIKPRRRPSPNTETRTQQ